MKNLVTVLVLIAVLLIVPLSHVTTAQYTAMPEEVYTSINASFEPHNFHADIGMEINNTNFTSLTGGFSLEKSACNVHGGFTLSGASSDLQGVSMSLSAVQDAVFNYYPSNKTVKSDNSIIMDLAMNATEPVNQSVMDMSLSLKYNSHSEESLETSAGLSVFNATSSLHMLLQNATSTMKINTSIDMNGSTIHTGNRTTGQGNASGTIYIYANTSQMPQPFLLDIDLTGNLEFTMEIINETSANLSLYAVIYLDFPDYMTAFMFATMLNNTIATLNLSQYVSVTVPPFGSTTVTVEIEYNGIISLAPGNISMGLPIPGMPQTPIEIPQLGLTNLTFGILLPVNISETEAHGSLHTSINANVTPDGNFTVNGSLEASLTPCPATCPDVSVYGDIGLSSDGTEILVNAHIDASNLPDPFLAFAITKSALETLAEDNNTEFDAHLEASNGVSLVLKDTELSSVDITSRNASLLEDLGIKYNGIIYYGPDMPAIAYSSNITLPLAVSSIKTNLSMISADVPFPAIIAGNPVIIDITNSTGTATIMVEPGSHISNSLIAAVAPADESMIPSNISAQPIGPAVIVRNVSGQLELHIKLNSTEASNIALLVIHDNGSISIYTNITVEDEFLVATVPAQSTFIPITITGGGGGGTGTTTTSATSSPPVTTTTPPPTTTSPMTTTTTASSTTTTSPGTTTPSTTTTTTKTTVPPTITSPGGTTTSPTQTATQTTTTTSTTSQPGQQTTTTTTKTTTEGGTSPLKIAAIIVVVIIVLGAAYAAMRTR